MQKNHHAPFVVRRREKKYLISRIGTTWGSNSDMHKSICFSRSWIHTETGYKFLSLLWSFVEGLTVLQISDLPFDYVYVVCKKRVTIQGSKYIFLNVWSPSHGWYNFLTILFDNVCSAVCLIALTSFSFRAVFVSIGAMINLSATDSLKYFSNSISSRASNSSRLVMFVLVHLLYRARFVHVVLRQAITSLWSLSNSWSYRRDSLLYILSQLAAG